MINVLQDIRDYLGMDANYFFPALIPLITMIISVFRLLINNKQNRLLELHVKHESQIFYGYVMFLDMGIVFCESIIYTLLFIIFNILFTVLSIQISLVYIKIIIAIFVLLSYLISVKIVKKRVFIRNRILGYRMAKWLLYIPLVIMHLYLYLIFNNINNAYFNIIIDISIVIVELAGLIYFPSRYKRYEYSSVRIYTNSNKFIDCEDISQIVKKHDAVVIMNGGIENRIKYDCITRVEYYGEPKVILKEEGLSKYIKIIYQNLSKYIKIIYQKRDR